MDIRCILPLAIQQREPNDSVSNSREPHFGKYKKKLWELHFIGIEIFYWWKVLKRTILIEYDTPKLKCDKNKNEKHQPEWEAFKISRIYSVKFILFLNWFKENAMLIWAKSFNVFYISTVNSHRFLTFIFWKILFQKRKNQIANIW